ncbi:MAG: rRNA maturation RNase YbeY [Candidatus Nitrosotalea sp.]|nr:rRNA maturation RNase YbeY [Candidatus Nitrosotalea sp.]
MIQIDTQLDGLDEARIRRFLAKARKAVGLNAGVSVLLTSDHEMQRLNRVFRRKNKPTDVLSFPMFDLTPGEKPQEDWADPDSGCVPQFGSNCPRRDRTGRSISGINRTTDRGP